MAGPLKKLFTAFLGAQFISGDKSTNPLFQYAESKNLLDDPPRQWEFYPTSFNPQGEAYSEEEFAIGYYLFDIIEQSFHTYVPELKNESLGDYYFSQVGVYIFIFDLPSPHPRGGKNMAKQIWENIT